MPTNTQTIFTIIMIVLIVALVVSIVAKLFRLALVMAVLTFVAPILITITWGDGSSYVAKFASAFNSDVENAINDGYQYYREEHEKDPGITDEQMMDIMNTASEFVKDKTEDYADDVIQSLDEYISENIVPEQSLDEAMQENEITGE